MSLIHPAEKTGLRLSDSLTTRRSQLEVIAPPRRLTPLKLPRRSAWSYRAISTTSWLSNIIQDKLSCCPNWGADVGKYHRISNPRYKITCMLSQNVGHAANNFVYILFYPLSFCYSNFISYLCSWLESSGAPTPRTEKSRLDADRRNSSDRDVLSSALLVPPIQSSPSGGDCLISLLSERRSVSTSEWKLFIK